MKYAVYPFTSPILLTDAVFIAYGGHTGTSTPAQRQAAYFIAEKTASYDIETLLIPQTVTGTFMVSTPRIVLDWAYLNSASQVKLIASDDTVISTLTSIPSAEVAIWDYERSILDIRNAILSLGYYPYSAEVVYNAGLPTGTSMMPDMYLALTTYADIILNEISGYGNEAPGDIGVQRFTNQGYAEERVALLRTSFGTSPRANFARHLLNQLRKTRYVGL